MVKNFAGSKQKNRVCIRLPSAFTLTRSKKKKKNVNVNLNMNL